MEDDDGDMPVTTEGAREGDKQFEKPQHSSKKPEDVDDSGKSDAISSVEEKNGDVAAADHEDSVKPKAKSVFGLSGDVDSETNNGESHSDGEVPLTPKKVNGEVELSKYNEKDENADDMDSVSLTKCDVPENEDNSEQESRSRKRKRSVSSNELPDSDHSDASDCKGAKKPALLHASITAINNGPQEDNLTGETDSSAKCINESHKAASPELPVIITPPPLQDGVESSAQLTEYAQYLGLQPTVKFKCYKCGETGFPSMPVLQQHQNVCLKTLNKSQAFVKPTQTAAVEQTPSTNIRITRKVYLCSVCGTYYENWNLFLHIREVHKRHICLFCLGMFAHSDNLVSHLSVRHGVIEESFSSANDFRNEYKGSCFLMCCTCEKLFTERENFFDHNCVEGLSVSVDKACALCGLKGAHFPTCRQAFTDSDASPPQSTSSVSSALKGAEDTVRDPQLIQEQPVKKQVTSINRLAERKESSKERVDHESTSENSEKLRDLSDLDDEYDISNAASFCHVNIDETPERNKSNNEKDSSKDSAVDSNVNKAVSEIPPAKPAHLENKQNDLRTEEDIVKDKAEITTPAPENDEPKIEEGQYKEVADQKNITEKTLASEVTESTEQQKELDKDSAESTPEQLETEKCSNEEEHSETANLDDSSDKSVQNEVPKVQEQEESDVKLSSKPEDPKSPPKSEAQSASKTPSATEAESESESSEDSAEETDESSTSSESSDGSNHNDDDNKEKADVADSDIDNADSDKMSLVVDETKSEDEKELQDEENDRDEMHSDGAQQNENAEGNIVEELNRTETNKEADQDSENEGNQEAVEEMSERKEVENKSDDFVDNIQLAGEEVPLLELTLEENLDTLSIQTLLKESVKISCLNCVYCNHAKKIAVNGKQLALHLLAEHRFAPVVCSDSGELTEVDGFVDKLKVSLPDLQQMYFNTDSYDNMDPNCIYQYDRTYECFHCHFVTTLHKELYVHNRKMHQKTILLCIMCKSNFYSYSELLCHLCPGIYVPESNITFRCCLCTVDGLPSAFRLMVHLRKRHHACDVCLETTGDQQKLSNHVWKHKLHHLCYRCGIAYRNKPDITKHLFWKHGTESVLCKKCLQKKWPHVYHFCIPPNAFVCEECNGTFSRAVALKVHKRIHAGDLPYACDECEERYVSRKLLMKHQLKHSELPLEESMENKMEENGLSTEADNQKEIRVDATDETLCDTDELKEATGDDTAERLKSEAVDGDSGSAMKTEALVPDSQIETPTKESAEEPAKLDEKEAEKKSRVVDVYDLPPLNLSSESDDTDEEEEEKKSIPKEEKSTVSEAPPQPETETKMEETDKTNEIFPTEEPPIPIVDGIWDNFKNYKASLERRESQQAEIAETSTELSQNTALRERESAEVIEIINMDHDYCGPAAGPSQSKDVTEDAENAPASSATSLQENPLLMDEQKETDDDKKPMDADHNYCFNNPNSPSSNVEKEKESLPTPLSATTTPSKKKQKSPKKKQKRSGSSSSSDSSSNSDSSSCSCGTNCSCSSSSSSSSGSSSSSSDSDSSTSEGRRRQAARRERRRERAKKRKSEEISDTAPAQPEVTDAANLGPASQNEAVAVPIGPELEETELPVRESDLDTDETETDEDFYDKYPQKLANKLLAEKRNQLLMLAAVAPVNNGTMTQAGQSPRPSSMEDQGAKKKVKTKKRKRSHVQHTNASGNMEQKLKMNIPTDYYTSQNPTFSKSSLTSATMSPLHVSSQSHTAVSHPDPSSLSTTYHSTGSGSETESKRASKRKRVPKRFYGDSSDEETEQQPAVKWRKVVTTTSGSPLQTSMPTSAYAYKSTPLMTSEPTRVPPASAVEDKSEEEEEEEEEAGEDSDSDVRKSSSDSSNSESEGEKEDDASDGDSDADSVSVFQTNTSAVKEGESGQQKNENLYCYCQCPYDEVSEMIACDGKDCTIEWFHFECVGIMVPPKGKWFCPDCRKRATSRSDYVPNV